VSGRNVLSREFIMTKKVWQAPKVETTPVSMEVTMYLPAQA
jgi:coenzyme PQQ precursor peptide PqqA